MITILFAALLLLSVAVALVDWRRGWLLALLCGVLQDPARKLTPGTPVAMTLSIVVVYAVVLFSAQGTLQKHAQEFSRRFSAIKGALAILGVFMMLAAVNGLATFGLANWKAPALAMFVYCAPVPAVLLGFTFLQREEQMFDFFRFYAVITSAALIGTVLEYFNLDWRALGTVALSEGNYRFLPGLSIRMLSGFYRAPDIMGWHAATLSMIGLVMSVRARTLRSSWPWMLVTAWGFLNCLISGRRKAVYMVAVFAAAFLWRYIRSLTVTQVATIAVAGLTLLGVVTKMGSDETASVYTRSTATTGDEVFTRLEGGMISTIEQFGIMGAGLGTATQGVYHVLDDPALQIGWQEGGLAKLTMELGLPGLLAVGLFAFAIFSFMMKVSGHPDVRGSSKLLRSALFAIVVADIVEFFISAQAYSDAMLTLMSAFFLGCLFATALLDERTAASEVAAGTALSPSPA